MSISTLVLVNPASAGGRTARRWPAVRSALRAAGVEARVQSTHGPGDATSTVRAALRAGCERIVVAGGDGTLNEAVNGFFDEQGELLQPGAQLGLLPSGTGGDFRRTLGIPVEVRAAVAAIAGGALLPLDVGRIDYASGERRFFVNIADCGVGGAVVARVNRSTRKRGGATGSLVFLWHSMATLLTFEGAACTVTVDGEEWSGTAESVVVANGQFFGGGMHIAPRAAVNDGLFDVVIVEQGSRLHALTSLPKLYRGTHLSDPGVTALRGRSVTVTTRERPLLFDVEGEQVGETPATLTCLKGVIQCCVPAARGAAGGPARSVA